MGNAIKEAYSQQSVTYTLEMVGKFYIVEHVPARVRLETGEQYFSPEMDKRMVHHQEIDDLSLFKLYDIMQVML